LKKKCLTFFVLANDASRTRQIKIPVTLIKGICVAAATASLILAFVVYDYVKLKGNALELGRLRRENISQKLELQNFAGKIRGIEDQYQKLSMFDKKLRIVANIEKPKGSDRDELKGLGGDSTKDVEDYLSTPKAKVDDLLKDMHSEINQLEQKAISQEKSFVEIQEHLMNQSLFFAATPSIWPVKGWVTSPFGVRTSPFTGTHQMHKGMDIANRVGTPVVSTADGIVVKATWDSGFGKTVSIRHGYGMVTVYGHLSEINVRVGQKVKRGQKIAAVGSTGHSTGPHLHYAVSMNGVEVNPAKYILVE